MRNDDWQDVRTWRQEGLVVECGGLDVLASFRPLLECWIQKWTSSVGASRQDWRPWKTQVDWLELPGRHVDQVHVALALVVLIGLVVIGLAVSSMEVVVEAGDVEEVVGDGWCESEIECGVVGSTTHSVVEELISVPEPELETVGPLDHLHKIDHDVPSVEGSIRSSTSTLERWKSSQGTWQDDVRLNQIKTNHFKHDASTWPAGIVIRLQGPPFSSRNPIYTAVSSQKWMTCTIEPHQKPSRERRTTPKGMSWCLSWSCDMMYMLMSSVLSWKGNCWRGFRLCSCSPWGESPIQRAVV